MRLPCEKRVLVAEKEGSSEEGRGGEEKEAGENPPGTRALEAGVVANQRPPEEACAGSPVSRTWAKPKPKRSNPETATP
jgi:hypothetical protein